ncbi:MAG: hypothetical protein AAF533_21095 [Acidobacteriota bacterium]
MTTGRRAKKQRSVGEVVADRRESLEQVAESFRAGATFPSEVTALLAERGLTETTALLVEDGTPPPCCAGFFAGRLLTTDERFLDFEVEDGELIRCEDVTGEVDVSPRIRGVGTSDGWLALVLLRRWVREGKLSS